MQIVVFTDLNHLIEYIEGNILELLLISEDAPMDKVESDKVKNVLFLSEGNDFREKEGRFFIYKFQSADKIMEEIEDYYKEKKKSIRMPEEGIAGKKEFLGFFSLGGESAYLSYAIACHYGKKYKVLLICFDLFSGGDERNYGNFSDLLYYLQQKEGDLSVKLFSVIQHEENIDVISGVHNFRDLYQMNEENMEQLVRILQMYGNYDYILFHFGHFDEAIMYLMGRCNKIYLACRKDSISFKEQEEFRKLLDKEGRGEIQVKCKPVYPPWIPEEDKENDEWEAYMEKWS